MLNTESGCWSMLSADLGWTVLGCRLAKLLEGGLLNKKLVLLVLGSWHSQQSRRN